MCLKEFLIRFIIIKLFANFVIFGWYVSYFCLLVLLCDDDSESEVLIVGTKLLLFGKTGVNCGADDDEVVICVGGVAIGCNRL